MSKTSHDSEILAQGQQVITACTFLHHSFDGVIKVFLPKRANTKKFLPGVYELPGGHIDFGEDLIAGLKREVREEFDMDCSVGDPFAAFTYTNEVKGSHSIEVIFFAQFNQQWFFLGQRQSFALIQLVVAARVPEEEIKRRAQRLSLCRTGIVSVS